MHNCSNILDRPNNTGYHELRNKNVKLLMHWYLVFALLVLEEQHGKKENVMSNEREDMQAEYDFSSGVRGKHYRAYQQGINVVFLEDDIAAIFKDSASVNHALRKLISLTGNEIDNNQAKVSHP